MRGHALAARETIRLPIARSGGTNLSTLVLLRPHLTETNVEELADAASGKSKREVEELLARRAPRPDVPSTVRKLPVPSIPPSTSTSAYVPPPQAHARIEPLAAARYKVQFTASTELRDKLERARDLMRHRNPSGDLAVIVERALDVLLEKLKKETRGQTERPQRNARPAKAGHVKRSARRSGCRRCAASADSGVAPGQWPRLHDVLFRPRLPELQRTPRREQRAQRRRAVLRGRPEEG